MMDTEITQSAEQGAPPNAAVTGPEALPRWAIFDTETSDLINMKAPADAEGQGRLAEIAMVFLDADLVEIGVYQRYVKPNGWSIQPDAFKANGLTDEFLAANGVPVSEVLDNFTAAVRDGYAFAAFNAQFDAKCLRGELRRADRDDMFEDTKQTCLMRALSSYNKASGRKGGWIDLDAAIGQIGYAREGTAHTGLSDVRAAVAVFRYLHERGALFDPRVHYAKNRP